MRFILNINFFTNNHTLRLQERTGDTTHKGQKANKYVCCSYPTISICNLFHGIAPTHVVILRRVIDFVTTTAVMDTKYSIIDINIVAKRVLFLFLEN